MKTEKPTSKQWNKYVMVASVNPKPKTESFQKLVSHHQLFWTCQAFWVVFFDFCFESFIKVSDNTGDDQCVCLNWSWKTSEQGQTAQTYSPLPLSKWVTRYMSGHVFKSNNKCVWKALACWDFHRIYFKRVQRDLRFTAIQHQNRLNWCSYDWCHWWSVFWITLTRKWPRI